MKITVKSKLVAIFAALLVFGLAGCKEPSPNSDPAGSVKTLSGNISISPSVDVTVGTPLTAYYSGSEAVTYLWKKGENNVGTNHYSYTPSEPGSYTVTVSATGYNSKTSAAVTVTGAPLPPLTGTVSISGTAVVGQTLTAVTTSLDGDGNISYQWKRGSTVIGTDSPTYTVQSSDVGSVITVTVTRAGYSGSKTSEAVTAINAPLTGTVSISGFAVVGQMLTADTASLDGNGNISYQWKRGGTVIGTNSATYTVQSSDVGSAITVTVTRAGYSGSKTSDPTAVVIAVVFSTPGLEFKLINNGAAYSVSKGTASAAEVVIPVLYEGKPVTAIELDGFNGYTNMTSVTIPNSVTSIGNYAFYNCTGLTSITIPNSVTSIGRGAFFGCSGLTSITIPFTGADLNGPSNTHFGYIFGATDYDRQNSFIPVSLKTVDITGVGINGNAFYGCTGLTSVTISNSVMSIGGNAFNGCTGLTSVTIPNSVTSIGNYAFYNCTGLTSVTIPNSVTSIGSGAFSSTGLTSVTIPDSVTSINSNAFWGCTGLMSVTIPTA